MANSEIAVKDRYNMTIGWVRDYGDRSIAIHIRKGYVGSYVKSSNITTDKDGKIYCYGDGLQDLIRSSDRS